MPQRKVWTEEEDNILRLLKEERGEKKWSQIAKKMELQFGIKGRTGKQCRERYHNHLDSSIVTSSWSAQEEQLLFLLHQQVGNKWSIISQKLPGRSDNCVKNHFYSKLRKSTRKLNKLILEHHRKEYKQIKIAQLYRVIQVTEERFKNNSKIDQQAIDKCLSIKNRLFRFEETKEDSQEFSTIYRSLIEDLLWFQGKSKKSCKEHKSSTQTNYSMLQQQIEKPAEKEEPFYLILKRVCEEIMLDQNS